MLPASKSKVPKRFMAPRHFSKKRCYGYNLFAPVLPLQQLCLAPAGQFAFAPVAEPTSAGTAVAVAVVAEVDVVLTALVETREALVALAPEQQPLLAIASAVIVHLPF